MNLDFPITADLPLSIATRELGISNWKNLVSYIQKLPYGRNKNRQDLSLVLKEKKGSCSSKHGFLKAVAQENKQDAVTLILAIYKMNGENTGIGSVIETTGLSYIPEAHCYLKIENERIDITSSSAAFDNLKEVILSEIEITPDQVTTFKVAYHQEFLKNWIEEIQLNKTFEEVWEIRESCIQYLSSQSN
ncbi:hypothetical protein [uncultured Tenacibaculum sp.]|uniref:hypothetical protein n=1 Tax=uncultured Tenacibaculum sp. TaxID=174713 RepID=UPI0026061A7D|nr:hypothetical protein [uncultured Tenacibaculum sp.]